MTVDILHLTKMLEPESLEWWIEGLLLFITANIGIIGNLAFVTIFTINRKNINTFHSLMVFLALFDAIYLIAAMLIFSVPILWPNISTTSVFTHLITILLPTAHIGINGNFNFEFS